MLTPAEVGASGVKIGPFLINTLSTHDRTPWSKQVDGSMVPAM